MGKQAFTQFRGVLRAAICNQPQAQFALTSGISPEHLNRMLNAETINRPTKQTLIKIASAAKNGITYQMLKNALDHDDAEIDVQEEPEIIIPFEKQADDTYKALCEFIKESVTLPAVMPNELSVWIDQLLENFYSKHSDMLPISYEIGNTHDYYGHTHHDVDKWVNVYLSISDKKKNAESDILLYFSPFKNQIVLQDASMALNDIIDLYGYPTFLLDEKKQQGMSEQKAMETIAAMPYAVEISPVSKFKDPYRGKNLLDSIFGPHP